MERTVDELANAYYYQGKYPEAIRVFERSLATKERKLGPDHLGVAFVLSNMGHAYYYDRKFTKAVPLYQRALSIVEKNLGQSHRETAIRSGSLAAVLFCPRQV